VCGFLPPLLSLASVALIVGGIITGWDQGRGDEGTAAHLFQLMMAAQLPLIVAFLVTADWRRPRPVFRIAMFQAFGIAAVIAVGLYFKI